MSGGSEAPEEDYRLLPRQPSLVRFIQDWTATTLDPQTRQEFVQIFDRLTRIAFSDHQTQSRTSQLCDDGSPLELSIAINSLAQVGQRFVCDIAGGFDESPATSIVDQLRVAADIAVPQFPDRSATLDGLFASHLVGRRPESRFLVWLGAGASRGKNVLGKLYFNTEWLGSHEVATMLEPLIPPTMIDPVLSLPERCGSHYKCFAYDFDRSGLCNVKVYLQPSKLGMGQMFNLLDAFPDAGNGRLQSFLAACLDVEGFQDDCPFAMVLGLKQGPAGFVFEPKIYVHLPSLGHETMISLAPIMQRVFGRWGFPAMDFAPRGGADFEPTLAGLAIAGGQEGIAFYFKPARK